MSEPKKPMRMMTEMSFSNDDCSVTRLQYPNVLTHAELADLKDMVAIWLRQLERTAVASFNDLYDPSKK